MNNLFKKYSLDIDNFDFGKIQGATTNLQDATSTDVAFYRLFENLEAQELFAKRLSESDVGLVIVSTEPRVKVEKPYVVLDYAKYEAFQYEIVKYLYPKCRDVKVIGVTGTNGKSTVVHLCQELLKANGKKSFSIGTIGVFEGDKELMPSPGATTPSYLDLCRILHTQSNYDFVCLEVSSHSLVQNRLGDIRLESAGWTNISQDHLDYHKTMDEYFEAKLLIAKYVDRSIILSPKEEGLVELFKKKSLPYEQAKEVSYSGNDAFRLGYNQKNLALAYRLVKDAIGCQDIVVPENLSLPKGRYNTFRLNSSVFVVDYAHTPDAIINVCSETKKSFEGYHLITVFGCGGDRDRSKRPKMLEAALKYSDEVVVTTDNPRTENPRTIVEDIVDGVNPNKFKIIISRSEAIQEVVQDYKKNTIVIIAGKGHEEYQDVNGVKKHFSDIEEIEKSLGKII